MALKQDEELGVIKLDFTFFDYILNLEMADNAQYIYESTIQQENRLHRKQ